MDSYDLLLDAFVEMKHRHLEDSGTGAQGGTGEVQEPFYAQVWDDFQGKWVNQAVPVEFCNTGETVDEVIDPNGCGDPECSPSCRNYPLKRKEHESVDGG